jgi:phosphoribosyl 1,2-cyclic phosphodiesterase
MRLRFWGVRGSTPTPRAENLKFGGNTPCVEIRTPAGDCLIFDAGTGIRDLGQLLAHEAAGEPVRANIFLTHFHWDHIQGIPFFDPLYGAKNTITFNSGLAGTNALQTALEGQMADPYFPLDISRLSAHKGFREIEAESVLEAGGAAIRPFALNHPQGACGYRIECGKSVVVYATDFEHGNSKLDAILLAQSQNADILICDSQYTPQEYESHRGWGHSTWLHATALAREAGVKQLLLFHHDPDHDDQAMARIQSEARGEFENTAAAWEGLTVVL